MIRLTALLLSFALYAAEPRTILLVRHAEKASTDTDTPLSEKGRARAQALAETLRDVPLAKIYVSQFQRTRQTAEPVATKKAITPELAPDNQLDQLVDKLRHIAPGSVALVVQHSNTVPQIVAKLGAGTIPPIVEAEFDRLVIVTIDSTGKARAMTLRYGGR